MALRIPVLCSHSIHLSSRHSSRIGPEATHMGSAGRLKAHIQLAMTPFRVLLVKVRTGHHVQPVRLAQGHPPADATRPRLSSRNRILGFCGSYAAARLNASCAAAIWSAVSGRGAGRRLWSSAQTHRRVRARGACACQFNRIAACFQCMHGRVAVLWSQYSQFALLLPLMVSGQDVPLTAVLRCTATAQSHGHVSFQSDSFSICACHQTGSI